MFGRSPFPQKVFWITTGRAFRFKLLLKITAPSLFTQSTKSDPVRRQFHSARSLKPFKLENMMMMTIISCIKTIGVNVAKPSPFPSTQLLLFSYLETLPVESDAACPHLGNWLCMYLARNQHGRRVIINHDGLVASVEEWKTSMVFFFSLYNLVIYFFNNRKPYQKMPPLSMWHHGSPCWDMASTTWRRFFQTHTVQEALNWMFFFILLNYR